MIRKDPNGSDEPTGIELGFDAIQGHYSSGQWWIAIMRDGHYAKVGGKDGESFSRVLAMAVRALETSRLVAA